MKDIVVPTVAESVTSGVIARWNKSEGDFAAVDDVLFELETDKVTMEVRAEIAGVVSKHMAKAGDTVNVGQVVGKIDETAKAPAAAAPTVKAEIKAEVKAESKAAPAASKAVAVATPPAAIEDVKATPLARKMADEYHIDISKVVGTGAGGRVREQDVLAAVQSHAGNGTQAPTPAASRVAVRERMTPIRQRIAQRLVEAQHNAAMLTTFNEVDMSAVMALRAQYKEEFEKKHAIGLGFMGFFVRAAASALKAFPLVNAYIVSGPAGELMIEKHDSCDISVAVSTPKGLTVPVIRGAERLSFAQIESKIKDLAVRARDGKLSLDELQGGTFSITNGGIYGSLMSTPILNPPQSAILGMHAIKNRAVEDPKNPGHVAIRPMMYLALSYDHRIIDGAEAVQFLVHIKKAIEDPTRLLLDM